MYLDLSGVIDESVVDGPGLRFVVFTQGCPHHCKGCHNPQTHEFGIGKQVDVNKLYKKIKSNPIIQGVTFSGGEPFCQAKALCELAQLLKNDNIHIMSYTGYTFEELLKLAKEDKDVLTLLSLVDILVDGRFVLEKRDLLLKFKGSSNQRILDCKKSMDSLKAVIIDI